jgi:osmotically-inducible protein OsmY
MMRRLESWRALAASLSLALFAAGAVVPLAGCVAAAVAGAGTAVMVATDRRSAGAQVDDETIELKIAKAITDRYSSDVHVNVISYNGIVLLVGQVPSTVIQDELTQLAKTTERVRLVENDTTIGAATDFNTRANDAAITGKVKARMIEAAKFAPNHVKVVTERSIVYLMGIVTRQEAEDAAQIAATTSGVARVVKVFEYMS